MKKRRIYEAVNRDVATFKAEVGSGDSPKILAFHYGRLLGLGISEDDAVGQILSVVAHLQFSEGLGYRVVQDDIFEAALSKLPMGDQA